MLKIENLHVSYGGIKALRGISLEVPDGKIVTLMVQVNPPLCVPYPAW